MEYLGWFHVFVQVVVMIASTAAIWFLYLQGGFKKQWKKMIPYVLLMILECIYVDVLFQAQSISGTTILRGASILIGLITVFLFGWEMVFCGILLLFYETFLVYQFIVYIELWRLNGGTIR